jgi:NADH dehydrogenase FAD-containing subunit
MIDNKQNIILLGDGFFARGFLRTINHKMFNITQIYRDRFINPQDIMYSLQRNKKYDYSYHFRDIFIKKPNLSIQMDIKNMEINNNNVLINNNLYNYDYLVIGLGAQKSLKYWKDDINNYSNIKNKNINILGIGNVGYELASILSKFNNIYMFDMLPKQKLLNFVSENNKDYLFKLLDWKNITLEYEKPINEKYTPYKIFCFGIKPNILTKEYKINKYLQYINNPYVYIGGDCVNTTDYIKNAQVAYQQGVYVAKRLNKEIENNIEFEYKHNGTAVNIGDKKVLIEKHKYLPDGIYRDFIIKLYSIFFI